MCVEMRTSELLGECSCCCCSCCWHDCSLSFSGIGVKSGVRWFFVRRILPSHISTERNKFHPSCLLPVCLAPGVDFETRSCSRSLFIFHNLSLSLERVGFSHNSHEMFKRWRTDLVYQHVIRTHFIHSVPPPPPPRLSRAAYSFR